MTHWTERHRIVPAVYVIFRKGNEVLLLKRANTGYRDGWYSLPSGHIEPNENPTQAAIREVAEEVGVAIKRQDLQFAHVQHRMAEEKDHERVDYFFQVRKWQGEVANAEPDKCDELKWSTIDTLPSNVVPEVASVLKSVARHAHYSEAGYSD
jgi:8-oxo-dGTP diphosphatase